MSQSFIFAVALTLSEWESLLKLGVVRLAKRRIQKIPSSPIPQQLHHLYAWAPMTSVAADSSDVLVLELDDSWENSVPPFEVHPEELILLPLTMVADHHVVEEDLAYQIEEIAADWAITISHGRYAESWRDWASDRTWEAEATAITDLLGVFGLDIDLRSCRDDGLQWREVTKLARGTSEQTQKRGSRLEVLLTSIRRINSEIIEFRDLTSFLIHATFRWIQCWNSMNDAVKLRSITGLESRREHGGSHTWHPCAHEDPDVFTALHELATKYPDAFDSELSPQVIGHLLRIAVIAKEEQLDRFEFEAVIRALMVDEKALKGAGLICVVAAAILGPSSARRLAALIRAAPQSETILTPNHSNR